MLLSVVIAVFDISHILNANCAIKSVSNWRFF